MAKGNKVKGVYYMTRLDGVKLYRFATPNTKTGDEWDTPQFKIRQDQTGNEYSEAIDVENAPYTYTETDKPIEDKTGELTVDDALEVLNEFGVDTTDDN